MADIDQTLPDTRLNAHGRKTTKTILRAMDSIESKIFCCDIKEYHKTTNNILSGINDNLFGFYAAHTDTIWINPSLTDDQFVCVLLHEIGHAICEKTSCRCSLLYNKRNNSVFWENYEVQEIHANKYMLKAAIKCDSNILAMAIKIIRDGIKGRRPSDGDECHKIKRTLPYLFAIIILKIDAIKKKFFSFFS